MVVYSILNTCNYKRYIGSTSDFKRRKREHIGSLNKNNHYNKHLQRAWTYYGEEYFEFEVIEETDAENRDIREEFWIDYFCSYKSERGYNMAQYPEIFSNYEWSDQQREAQRKRKLGIPLSEEHKEKISNSLKGIKKPEGFGEHMSETRTGKNNPGYGKQWTDDHKNKISIGNTGKFHTEETKLKMSISQKKVIRTEEQINRLKTMNIGRKHSEEFRLKASVAKKGVKFSDEHKKNMSLVRLGEKHKNSKLKNEDVECLKYLLNYNIMSQSEMGRLFKVSPQTINAIYKNRIWGHLTVYRDYDADVRCLGTIEGTGKNVGKLGSITIQFEHEGKAYKCNCGSGFSDEERSRYWKQPELIVGHIVTVGYFEVSKNAGGDFGLRFPTWKSIIRHDKTEISMN